MDAKKRICCLVAFLAFVALFFGVGSIVESSEKRVSLSGWFVVVWQDRLPAANESPKSSHEPPHYFLIDGGRWIRLAVDEEAMSRFGGLMAFNRRRVTLEGRWQPLTDVGVEQGGEPKFRVESIRREQDGERLSPMAADAEAVVRGSQPWVTVLCRFADSTAITPRERSWFDGLMLGDEYPAMNHYWRELSDNQINLAGSRVVGWHNLPRPRSYYVYDKDGDGVEDADLPRLTSDCAAVADDEVHFPQFTGVNLVFNESIGCCAFGGATWLSLDGQEKMYGATWIAAQGGAQTVWAHEMGHGFGLMHSSGPYNNTYDSAWDVMSSLWWTCSVAGPHPVFSCVGQHTIAWHKDLLGWIPSERLYKASPGSSITIEMARLSQPSGAGYLLAKIPIAGSSADFYTVETRQRIGYDGSLPGDAIVIHRVNTGRWDRIAQVVDVDNNGNPNDEGAMWLPGETFIDAANSIEVSVVGATAGGFLVAIKNGGLALPLQISTRGQISQKLHYAQSSNSFYGVGSDAAVWKWDNSSKQWSRITGCCIKDDFHFLAENNLYALGLDNQVWHWNGWSWSQASEGGRFQHKIWYSGGYVYGIGMDNQVWRMIWRFGSAAEWTKITSGSIKIRDDFHFVSESEIYGIGLDSQIWKWNGISWSQHSFGGHIGQSLDFGSESALYGIGADNRIWGWLNGIWSALHDGGQVKDDFVIVGNAAYGIGLDGQIWQLSSD